MKIGIVGATGRMGQMLIKQVHATDGCTLVGAANRPSPALRGKDVGELAGVGALGVPLGDDTAAVFKAAEVVIDFTVPAATLAHIKLAGEHGCNLIIGTTGLTAEHDAAIAEATKKVAIMQAPNMSAGVVMVTALAEQVARSLGAEYDIEVLDMHHRHKIDAPSGTALAFGSAAAPRPARCDRLVVRYRALAVRQRGAEPRQRSVDYLHRLAMPRRDHRGADDARQARAVAHRRRAVRVDLARAGDRKDAGLHA